MLVLPSFFIQLILSLSELLLFDLQRIVQQSNLLSCQLQFALKGFVSIVEQLKAFLAVEEFQSE